MQFSIRQPKPPLATFVEIFWYWEGYHASHVNEHLIPTGTTELVFDLNTGHAELVGAHSKFSTLSTSAQVAVLGVHFRAGGGFPFFGGPARELTDHSIPLSDVWGHEARRLGEKILDARTIEARFDLVENALFAASEGRWGRHRAVAFALDAFRRQPFDVKISDLVDGVGLSSRRFIEVFHDEVGLTPKLYARVMRFRALIEHIHTQKVVDWAGVAAHYGYFDQAHLIKDFQQFCGFSPSEYALRKGEHLFHVPAD